jgi:hypothetical protein
MAVKNRKEGITIAQVQLVDARILHSLAPACVGGSVPCISAEAKENLVPEAY